MSNRIIIIQLLTVFTCMSTWVHEHIRKHYIKKLSLFIMTRKQQNARLDMYRTLIYLHKHHMHTMCDNMYT